LLISEGSENDGEWQVKRYEKSRNLDGELIPVVDPIRYRNIASQKIDVQNG